MSRVARDKSDPTDNHGKNVSRVASNNSAYAVSKHSMNTAIISAQQEVNLKSGDESLILVYRDIMFNY
ncbi:hypothetical protein [Shewanella sp.]|uniref:hypothetical protein n=1 Tax=Shewanella sp. TaxID=50422 RepID=UPI0025CBFDAC|nr:hypothetical protein [Shewanella sp.]